MKTVVTHRYSSVIDIVGSLPYCHRTGRNFAFGCFDFSPYPAPPSTAGLFLCGGGRRTRRVVVPVAGPGYPAGALVL